MCCSEKNKVYFNISLDTLLINTTIQNMCVLPEKYKETTFKVYYYSLSQYYNILVLTLFYS